MLKIESNNAKLSVVAEGTMCDIQKELSKVIIAMASNMGEKQADVFKITFIQAVLSGKLFDCTYEEMERLEDLRKAHYNNDDTANPWDFENEIERALSSLKDLLSRLEEQRHEDE